VNLFYHTYASFTNGQLPLLKVAALSATDWLGLASGTAIPGVKWLLD
jgi:hypothetical protein